MRSRGRSRSARSKAHPPALRPAPPILKRVGRPLPRGECSSSGGGSDRRFRAYETKTGRELWSVETEQLISGANPITYMGKDGRQYVAVAAGTTLLTYNLP